MKRVVLLVALAVMLGGCAHRMVDVTDHKAVGEKIITIDAPRAAWVQALSQHIRKKGFQIRHYSSQVVETRTTDDKTTQTYNKASARYVLNVNGYDNPSNRCFGGGWTMEYITADFVDVRDNITIFSYSNGGYTENCPPMSGSIFGDIANLIEQAWSQQ